MKNINKYLKCGVILGTFIYLTGTNNIINTNVFANEINTELVNNETTKEWKPEGNVIAQGEDGVPWELYENGYLLFKPETGKDTLNPLRYEWNWNAYFSFKEGINPFNGIKGKIKAIGSTGKIYLPQKSSGLFSPPDTNWQWLEYIDTTKFDTSNVKDLRGAFWNIGDLKELDLSSWDTHNVKDMINFFEWGYDGMNKLEYLNISNFDTTNIKYEKGSENEFVFYSNVSKKLKKLVIGDKLAKGEALKNVNLFYGLEKPFETELYTHRWVKEDGSAGPFTVEEWNRAYRNDPVGMSGTWVREKTPTKYTLNFDTSTTEQITPLSVEKDNQATLPTPTVDNTGYKFLGWVKSPDGEIINNTTNIANPSETITLYAKWEKVDNIITERILIEPTTVYQGDNTLDKGQRNEVESQVGEKEIVTIYKVTPITGELTEPTTIENIITPMKAKIIRVGTKSKIEIIKNNNQTIERTTKYKVKENTGEISEKVTDKLISSNTPLIPNPNGNDLPDEPELNTNEKPEYKESVSTNTTTDEKGNEILPPVVEELAEYNGGANPTDSPVNEKPEYTGELSTNTPIDENENPILPPVVDELPEFTGSVNPSDAPIHEIPEYTNSLSTNTPVDDNGDLVLPPVVEKLPEYNGGVNSIEPPVENKPEYTGTLSTNTPVDEDLILPSVINELPNNKKPTLEIPDLIKPEEENKNKLKEEKINNKRELPNTNSSSVIASLALSIISTLGLGYKTKIK